MIEKNELKGGNSFGVWLPKIFETLVLFFIFCVFGGSPIPDVNEPYYIGKAIHFWNPDWVVCDTFLDTTDSHLTFYFLFGWLSFFLSPYWMAVLGRSLTWFLLAVAWRRLCFTILRVHWSSVPSGLAMAYFVSEFNMAGEWIIGGVEGKSFAFPFVLFGLAELVRGRWRRVWIYLGVASAFHVLVGGWSVIAVIIVHIFCRRKPDYYAEAVLKSEKLNTQSQQRGTIVQGRSLPPIPAPVYFMILGGLIALSGVIPCLLLDYGTVGEVVSESHRIYVFERLSHHLVPYIFTWTRILRFLLLVTLWIFCCRFVPHGDGCQRRFDFFVWGTLIISLIGFILAYVLRADESMSATVLRLYWFRMSDVAVPMGIAIGSMFRLLRLAGQLRKNPPCLPMLREMIIVAMISVGVFMIAGYFLFGGFMFSWSTVPDVVIAWSITVLVCRFILYVLCRVWQDCAILSFGKLKIWLIIIYVVILIYAPLRFFTELADSRTRFNFPKSESKKTIQAYKWREACNWIADNTNTPKSAKFFIPYDSVTFKWYANRSNTAVWKEVPQDAKSIVQWASSIEELFGDDENAKQKLLINRISKKPFSQMLIKKSPQEMQQLQEKYGFDYILAPSTPDLSKRFKWKIIYKNSEYCVYRVNNK
ncbi:MAG: hypothetical protein LBK06_07855 [Planctomycetaceae bacterium]|jgi:hypothetical protein|nr:hypothetical protein [Planctomycetaceae bacterium]